ncbi:hypothetical protein ACVWYF_002053 [Hymenobacter sp. UYAg731]
MNKPLSFNYKQFISSNRFVKSQIYQPLSAPLNKTFTPFYAPLFSDSVTNTVT